MLLIVLVGFYAGKRNIISQSGNKILINLIMQVTLPIFILNSFISGNTPEVRSNITTAFFYSLLVLVVMTGLSFLLLIFVTGREWTILHFSNITPNTGYVGFPLLLIIYGPAGVVYGSIFNMIMNLISWSYGIFLFEKATGKTQKKQNFWKLLQNPNLVAVYVGLILMFANVGLPHVIMNSLGLIGASTGPLSMIAIGITMTNINYPKNLNNWKLYYGVFTRMVMMPLSTIAIFYLSGINMHLVTKSMLVITAMPSATITSILAEKYDYEKDMATLLVILTTIMTILSAPLIIQLIETL